MILGITAFDDRMLLACHAGHERSPEFCECILSQGPATKTWPGHIWNTLETTAGNMYRTAEKIVLAVPAPDCYLKKLEIDSAVLNEYPDYLEWVACIRLPGEISQYRHEFIPVSKKYDDTKVEMIFSAMLVEPLNRLLYMLQRNNDPRQIIAVPEQLGLMSVLGKSLASDDIPQGAIINCSGRGATLVMVKNNRFCQTRFFPVAVGNEENLAVDIETYLLSQEDSSDPLPVVIIGTPGMLELRGNVLRPSFLPDDKYEFAATWGVAEYVHSTGDK